MIGLIAVYRRLLSPLKGRPTCRYLPTCSEYAAEAIASRGVVVGGAKALWRVCRCNPLSRGGFDPVDPGERERVLAMLARERAVGEGHGN